jgi:hypothetical protein
MAMGVPESPTGQVALYVAKRNDMVRAAILWILVLGTVAGLLWAWISLPFRMDLSLLVAAVAALPITILVVFGWNLRGVLVGSVLVWGSLMILRRIGEGLDPEFHGDNAAAYVGKTAFLWIVGIIFCLLIYGIKRLTVWLLNCNEQP